MLHFWPFVACSKTNFTFVYIYMNVPLAPYREQASIRQSGRCRLHSEKMMSILRLRGTHKQLLWTKCQVFVLNLAVKTAFIHDERTESTSENEILDSRKKLIYGKHELH